MADVECSDLLPRRKAALGRMGACALALAAAVLTAPASARAQDDAPMAAPVPAEILARAAAPDVETREGAIASLQALGTPGAFQLALVMLQRDLDPRVRAAAAGALGASRDPDFESALGYAARADPDPSVRAAAAASRATVAPFAKRPKVAAAFSVLCPGCGYFYLGQPERAVGFLGAAGGLLATGLAVLKASPLGVDTNGTVSHDPGRATPLLIAAQNVWFYGVFASYRDARLARGDYGARFPVAKEQLGDLALAPFNPSVLKSPWVWAGVPVMLGVAEGAMRLFSHIIPESMPSSTRSLADGGGVRFFGRHYGTASGVALGSLYDATLFTPVAVGEEALFRGVVQAGLSETSLGLWGGWAVGSAIFGAAHTFNFIGAPNGVREAAVAVPYLMLTGSYLGYVFIRTDFSLAASAAIHFWYDFGVSMISFVADPDHQPFVARFATPF